MSSSSFANQSISSVDTKYFSSIRKNSNSICYTFRNLKQNTWFWNNTLNISNEELNEIMKILQALEDSNILLKGISKTIKNGTKKQKE